MTAQELVEKLQWFPPQAEVQVYMSDIASNTYTGDVTGLEDDPFDHRVLIMATEN